MTCHQRLQCKLRSANPRGRHRSDGSKIPAAVSRAHSKKRAWHRGGAQPASFYHMSETNPHPELVFTNARVPSSNLLKEECAGFAIGQARLHHCVRAIGECEVSTGLMVKRSQSRSTFGKRIDKCSSTQAAISLSRMGSTSAGCLLSAPPAFWIPLAIRRHANRFQ